MPNFMRFLAAKTRNAAGYFQKQEKYKIAPSH
jgi:hypothetical protein